MLKGQSVKYEWNVRVGESEDDFETLATFEKFQDALDDDQFAFSQRADEAA